MTWSRTSTVNKAAPLSVGDGLAEYSVAGVQYLRQPLDQVLKIDGRRQQCVEPRIPKQSDRGGKPAVIGPSGAMCGRDLSDLARHELQPAAMEGAAKHRRDGPIAIPAH